MYTPPLDFPCLSQKVQNFFEGPPAAGEDGSIELGVGARLALAEFHHQVLELLGGLGLEGKDELVIVDTEAVGGVVLYRVVLAAYLHVLVHHALALFEGEAVPRAGLHERVDEEVLALAGDDMGTALEARCVLSYVDGASRQPE